MKLCACYFMPRNEVVQPALRIFWRPKIESVSKALQRHAGGKAHFSLLNARMCMQPAGKVLLPEQSSSSATCYELLQRDNIWSKEAILNSCPGSGVSHNFCSTCCMIAWKGSLAQAQHPIITWAAVTEVWSHWSLSASAQHQERCQNSSHTSCSASLPLCPDLQVLNLDKLAAGKAPEGSWQDEEVASQKGDGCPARSTGPTEAPRITRVCWGRQGSVRAPSNSHTAWWSELFSCKSLDCILYLALM